MRQRPRLDPERAATVTDLDTVQRRIHAANTALHEYQACGETGLVAICEQRLEELWTEHQRILDALPRQREG